LRALIVSAVAGALASFLVPILVAITYVTLLVALAVASINVPVEARLALSWGAAASTRLGVEVEAKLAAKDVQGRADAVADVGIVDPVHSVRIGRAGDRFSLAAARAGVPEPGVRWRGREELGVQGSGIAEARRFELFANASALVVLPDVVGRTSWVQADALTAGPSESRRALGRVHCTLTGRNVEPVAVSTCRCISAATSKAEVLGVTRCLR